MKKVLSPLFLIIFALSSCSFKKPEDNGKSGASKFELSPILDSDGDFETDLEESVIGTNPFVADVPTFSGEYFQEMKVITHLHHPKTHKLESISFQVRKNLTSENGTPVEERDYLGNGGQFLNEASALFAKRSSFQSGHFYGEFSGDDIGFYAPPRMNDLQIFPFSEKINELSKDHEFEEMEFYIQNRLEFSYKKAKSFTEAVFDLYWYNQHKQKFILIDSDYTTGVYTFNTNTFLPLTFKTTDPELARQISLSGGRFLYLKLRDFKILDNGIFYKQILDRVKQKSIPFIYFNGEKEEVFYVGKNSSPLNLEEILKNTLSQDFQVYNSKIVRVGDKSEKTELIRDAFGEGILSSQRFQLLTNEISNNPFTYSFIPGDVVALSYISSTDPYGLIPSYVGAKISSNKAEEIKTIKIPTSTFEDLRLNLLPGVVRYLKTTPERLLPCSGSSIGKMCWKYKTEEVTYKGIQALALTGLVKLKINNHEFRLDDLIASKDAIFRIKNDQIIEIKLKESILLKIPESKGLTITLSTSPRSHLVCSGEKICEASGNGCEKFISAPPRCDEGGNYMNYSIIDNTKKSDSFIQGEGFLSFEYL